MKTFEILYKISICIYTLKVIYRRLAFNSSAAVETIIRLNHEFKVNETNSVARRSLHWYENQ